MPLRDWSAPLRQLLFAPSDFFAERTRRDEVAGDIVALVAALHFVFFVGIFAVIILQLGLLSEMSFRQLLVAVGGPVIVQGVVLVVLVFLNWLIVSGVLHVVVKLVDGDGPFGATLYVVGWSSPVALLAPLVSSAGVIVAFTGVSSSAAVSAQLASARATVATTGILGAGLVLLWQGYIWAAGLRDTHDTSQEDAWLASAVTVVIGLIAVVLFG